jgi:hypothetical protein
MFLGFDSLRFRAGEKVRGVVVLYLTTPATMGALTLHFCGVERAAWVEGMAQDVVSETLRVADESHKIATFRPARVLNPGTHTFHFEFQTSPSLPRSYDDPAATTSSLIPGKLNFVRGGGGVILTRGGGFVLTRGHAAVANS